MNQQGVSEIIFEEAYPVPSSQTARSLFARLPHGSAYAETLIDCFATGYLVAVAESICIREMRRYIEAELEVVVGGRVRIEHRGAVPPGTCLRLIGWVTRLGERSATFCVQAHDGHELCCEGEITLVAAQREKLEARIASKVSGNTVHPGTSLPSSNRVWSGRPTEHQSASLSRLRGR